MNEPKKVLTEITKIVDECKPVTFKADEKNIQQILVDTFKETGNVGWLIELLLCYEHNVDLLKSLGLDIDEVKSFTNVKRRKRAKIVFRGMKLLRKKTITELDFSKIENVIKELREKYATTN